MSSLFDLPQELESINYGAQTFTLNQMIPVSGAMNGSVVGQGSSSNSTIFQWKDDVQWCIPTMSYYYLRLDIRKAGSSALAFNDLVAYCDNFVSALFSKVSWSLNSQQIESIDNPMVVDSVLTYSNTTHSHLKSYASLSRTGENINTRILNTTGRYVDVIYRPPISFYAIKGIFPPGQQLRVEFNWQSTAQYALESYGITPLVLGSSANQVGIAVLEFSQYIANCMPSQSVLPSIEGVLELHSSSVNSYNLNGGSSLRQNFTVPPTTNKISVAFQDTSTDTVEGLGRGYSCTYFPHLFSTGGTAFSAALNSFYIAIPELSMVFPQTYYNFDKTTQNDYMRAYADFCNANQGQNYAGAMKFGRGIRTNSALTVTKYNLGNLFTNNEPENENQLKLTASLDSGDVITSLGQSLVVDDTFDREFTRNGYFSHFILSTGVVRPDGKKISGGNIYASFDATVNVVVHIISQYSTALSVTADEFGHYKVLPLEGI